MNIQSNATACPPRPPQSPTRHNNGVLDGVSLRM
jgi:hypothetical protein